MSLKLPYLIAILLLIAAASGGVTYFVMLSQAASTENVPPKAQANVSPRTPLPTKGGQQMKLEF